MANVDTAWRKKRRRRKGAPTGPKKPTGQSRGKARWGKTKAKGASGGTCGWEMRTFCRDANGRFTTKANAATCSKRKVAVCRDGSGKLAGLKE